MSKASDVVDTLKGILDPEVLKRVHALAVPSAGIKPKDLFAGNTLHAEANSQLRQLLFQSVFVPLSNIPLSAYPDNMLHLLPPPDDKDFPVQATGLVVLLDQATRMTLAGVNIRWVNSFFDALACRIAKQLCDLPTELRIDNPQRWPDLDQGYSWEDGMIRAQFLHVPFVHSEDETSQRYATDLSEHRRVTVEARYNKRDPARTDQRAALEKDLDGFPRLLRGESPPPYYANADFPDFFWFRCQINRAHLPPLQKFGRYPWRNASVGRESTQEEKVFLESIKGFGQVDSDVAKAIARDVQLGIWTPLA